MARESAPYQSHFGSVPHWRQLNRNVSFSRAITRTAALSPQRYNPQPLDLATCRIAAQLVAGMDIPVVALDFIAHRAPCIARRTVRAVFRLFDEYTAPAAMRPPSPRVSRWPAA